MTNETALSIETAHTRTSSSGSSKSYDMPPSINTAIRPQLHLHEEDEPNSFVSTSQIRIIKEHTVKSRRGFDSSDFDDGHDEEHSGETNSPDENESGLSRFSDTGKSIGLREHMYHIVDGSAATAFLALVLMFDYSQCFVYILLILMEQNLEEYTLQTLYRAQDWTTAVCFLTDTNVRLYSYGLVFYFSSALRCCEYIVSAINAAFVLAMLFSPAQWLQITRFFRLIRVITLVVTWRERRLKWRTRQELEALAELLEKEKSDRGKLTKWRIESDDIAIGQRAGQGGFGTVFSGLFRGTLVAVKQLALFEREQNSFSIEDEAITLVNLRHPNVVLFMGFVHEPSKLWIVTEYCSRGSLRDLLDDNELPLTEGRALKLALGAARGLAYLHGQDPPVLHLDLKTSNILISSGWDAKLGDFGLSRNIENIENCFSGTVQYAAPEVLESNLFSTAADIYSFGVCLWEIAAREVPFKNESPMSVLWGVVKSNLRPSTDAICVKTDDCQDERDRSAIEASMNRGSESTIDKQVDSKRDLYEVRKVNGVIAERRRIDPLHPQRPNHAQGRFQNHHQRGASIASESALQTGEASPYTGEVSGPEKQIQGIPRVRDAKKLCYTQSEEEYKVVRSRGTNIVYEPTRHSNGSLPDRPREPHPTNNADVDNDRDDDRTPCQAKSRFNHQAAAMNDRHEGAGQLNSLTRRVTATIQKFDDRPPVVRRKEENESNRIYPNGISRRSDARPSGIQPNFGSMIKNTFAKKSSQRTSSTTSRKAELRITPGSESLRSPSGTTGESEAFTRRLANFSMHSSSRNIAGTPNHCEEDIGTPGTPHAAYRPLDISRKPMQPPVQVPKEYLDLIQKCWAQDPNQRPSASQIVWRLVLLIDGQMQDKSMPG